MEELEALLLLSGGRQSGSVWWGGASSRNRNEFPTIDSPTVPIESRIRCATVATPTGGSFTRSIESFPRTGAIEMGKVGSEGTR